MSNKVSPQEKQKALADLRELLAPGETVYSVIRHVSRSGMQRVIDLHAIRDNKPVWISWLASRALGWRMHQRYQGIVVDGCGMDMAFHLVYSLSYVLWPDGCGCTGEGCFSNDHSNGDRDFTPHGEKQIGWAECDACCELPSEKRALNMSCPEHSHWHRDGGYALKQRSL